MTIPFMGDDIKTLRFNSRYLIQATRSLSGDEIFIKHRDALSPVLLIPVDHSEWDERLEVVMLLRG
jgi:DNA polymerase III sliding clamp (beta) subunit (PCNA family)